MPRTTNSPGHLLNAALRGQHLGDVRIARPRRQRSLMQRITARLRRALAR